MSNYSGTAEILKSDKNVSFNKFPSRPRIKKNDPGFTR